MGDLSLTGLGPASNGYITSLDSQTLSESDGNGTNRLGTANYPGWSISQTTRFITGLVDSNKLADLLNSLTVGGTGVKANDPDLEEELEALGCEKDEAMKLAAEIRAQYCYSYMTCILGYPEYVAEAMLLNIAYESRFDPSASNSSSGAYGICQWLGDRYYGLSAWCAENGYDPDTLQGQLEYMNAELTSPEYSGTLAAIVGNDSSHAVKDILEVIRLKYERCGDDQINLTAAYYGRAYDEYGQYIWEKIMYEICRDYNGIDEIYGSEIGDANVDIPGGRWIIKEGDEGYKIMLEVYGDTRYWEYVLKINNLITGSTLDENSIPVGTVLYLPTKAEMSGYLMLTASEEA